MFAVQQGSKSDTSKEGEPAPLPGVSTPLNIEGSITFCSFLSTQPFIVNSTEITFKDFCRKFLPCLQFKRILSYVCIPKFGQKSCAKYISRLFVYLFFCTFFEILQYLDLSRS